MNSEDQPIDIGGDKLLDELRASEELAHFEVECEVGAGGMGRVFRARHIHLDKDVALKILSPGYHSPDSLRRFQREAKVLSSLDHSGIAGVMDFGVAGSLGPYMAMEFVDGKTLQQVVGEKGPLSAADFKAIFLDLIEALTHAHSRKIAHRDIKPGNIIVSDSGAVLVDFGIALARDASWEDSGRVIGTPLYSSPEHFDGAADEFSDQYSLGCVMFYALTGTPPFEAESTLSLAAMHKNEDPDFGLLREKSSLPEETLEQVQQIIATLLSKDPHNRFRDFVEVGEQLEAVEIPDPMDLEEVAEPIQDFFKSRSFGFLVSVALVGAIAALVFVVKIDPFKILNFGPSSGKVNYKRPVEVAHDRDKGIVIDPRILDLGNEIKIHGDITDKEVISSLSGKPLPSVLLFQVCPEVTSKSLEALASPNVTKITLKATSVQDLSFVEHYPELIELVLTASTVDSSSLRSLKGADRLEVLSLNSNLGINDASLEACPPLTSLTRLDLSETSVTRVPSASKFPALEILHLRSCKIKADSLSRLREFKSLKGLDVRDTGLLPSDLVSVNREIPRLSISLFENSIVSHGLDAAEQLLKKKQYVKAFAELERIEPMVQEPKALFAKRKLLLLQARTLAHVSPKLATEKLELVSSIGVIDESELEAQNSVAFELALAKGLKPEAIEVKLKTAEIYFRIHDQARGAMALRIAANWAADLQRYARADQILSRAEKVSFPAGEEGAARDSSVLCRGIRVRIALLKNEKGRAKKLIKELEPDLRQTSGRSSPLEMAELCHRIGEFFLDSGNARKALNYSRASLAFISLSPRGLDTTTHRQSAVELRSRAQSKL